jgi:hypothetical protein
MAHKKQRGNHAPVLFSLTYLCVCVITLGICWPTLGATPVGEFTDNDNYMFRYSRSFYAN